MAVLTVKQISLTGLNPAPAAAAAGGDSFANNGKTYLYVNNGGGGQITATIDAVSNCNFGFDHDAAVAVPAGETRLIGPFPTNRFGPTCGVTYSGVTSVTVEARSL